MFKSDSARPYWHVDMKWVTAIFLLISLAITLLLYQLYKFTAPKNAIETATVVVATMFSGGDLDKTGDLEEVKRKFPPDAEGKIRPLNGNPNVVMMATDLETLSPREIRLKIFRQVVEPIYYRGSGKEYASNLNDQEATKQLGVLAFLTEKNHKKIKTFLFISISITLVLFALLIRFSAGFGRFVGPAVIFLIVAIPGLFLTTVFSAQGSKKPPTLGGEKGYGELVGSAMNVIGPSLSKQFAYVYIPLFILSILLFIMALIGKIVTKKIKQS